MAGLTVLDANLLISLLDESDPHADAAQTILEEAGSLAASTVSFAEALVRPVEMGRTEAALELFESMGIREVAPSRGSAAVLARLRHRTKLKLPDCFVLLTAQQLRAESVGTRDERLGSMAGLLGFATP